MSGPRPEFLARVLARVEDPQYDDVVWQRAVEDHEGETANRKLADKTAHTWCAVRELPDQVEACVHLFHEGYGYRTASFRIPLCCTGKISVRLVRYEDRPGGHPRIAFSARVRACAGVQVLASPRR